MQEINHLKNTVAGLKFFSISISPKERIQTILFNDGNGFNWELSVHREDLSYRTDYKFYLVADNQFPYSIYELLKQTEHESFHKFMKDGYSASAFSVNSPEPKAQPLAEWLLSKQKNAVPEIIWTSLYNFFPQIERVADEEKTAFRFFTSMINALHEASKQRKVFPLADLEGFLSFASKEVLSKRSGSINIDRIKYINDDVVQLIMSRPFSSVNLNGLSNLQLNHAIQLSAIKGKLFLNSLASIDVKTAEALTGNKLDYLSLRGLNSISKELEELFKKSKAFISLKSGKEEMEEVNVAYDKDIIEQSVASNKKEFSNLKKLLSTPDKEVIDSGLSLLSAFSDPYLFDKLIERLVIDEQNGYQKLNIEDVFKGPKKDLPFNNYAITGILFLAGPDSLLAEKIKRKIKSLYIDIFDLSYLHCFYELEQLKIEDAQKKLTTLDELDEQLPIKKLDISGCSTIEDIQHLSVFPLQSFDFTDCYKIKSLTALQGKTDLSQTKKLKIWKFESLQNLDGIEFYQSLEWLDLYDCKNITNVSALKKLPSLQRVESISEYKSRQSISLPACDFHPALFGAQNVSINLSVNNWIGSDKIGSTVTENIELYCKGMTNLEWLKGFPNLTNFRISCKGLIDIKGLRYVPKLAKFDINDSEITDLQGLETLKDLEELQIQSCPQLKRIDEVENLEKLKDVSLRRCHLLESAEGMMKNKSIQATREWIRFNSLPQLKRIGDLSGFVKLTSLYFNDSFNQELLHDFISVKSPIEFNVSKIKIIINDGLPINFPIKMSCSEFDLRGSGLTELNLERSSMKDLSGLEGMPLLKKLTITDLEELETLSGLRDMPNLQEIKLINLKSLVDISILKELQLIQSLTMVKLPKVKDSSSLVALNSLENMDVEDCPLLEVKPRPMGKINKEQVLKYQLKLAEHYKLETQSLEVKVEKEKSDPAKKDAKKNTTKIKKLLKERDIAMIDTAISLLEGIKDEALMNELLFGIAYENNSFKTNRIFTGTGPAQPYLNYALTGVLSCAVDIDEWKSLVQSVTVLDFDIVGFKYLQCFENLSTLNLKHLNDPKYHFNLKSLKSLKLDFGSDVSLDLDIIAGCPNLEMFELRSTINQVNGFSGLKNLVNLKFIKLNIKNSDATHFMDFEKLIKLESLIIYSDYLSQPKNVLSLNGLHNCIELKELLLDSFQIQDTTALSKLSKLQMLEIENGDFETLELAPVVTDLIKLKVSGCKKLNKISDSLFNEELKDFIIDNTAFTSFPKLKGVKRILRYEGDYCYQMLDLKGLKGIEYLKTGYSNTEFLAFNNCPNLEDINDVFDLNISKLSLDMKVLPKNIIPNKITHLVLGNIESLDGIEQFPMLEFLSLKKGYEGSAPIKQLSSLEKLKNLKYLKLGNCKNLESLEGLEKIEHLKMLDLTRMENLKDIKVLENMNIDALYISGCLLKKVDFPSHLQDNIDWQSIP